MLDIGINEKSIRQSNSGQITGEIYFEVNNKYFPEMNWSDFPVIILSWWMNNFLKAIDYKDTSIEFYFMDGPYGVVGKLIASEKYEMSFVEQRGEEKETIMIVQASQTEIKNVLLKTCRKLFRALELENISSENMTSLKELYVKLKNIS